jgi:hypothetical protein
MPTRRREDAKGLRARFRFARANGLHPGRERSLDTGRDSSGPLSRTRNDSENFASSRLRVSPFLLTISAPPRLCASESSSSSGRFKNSRNVEHAGWAGAARSTGGIGGFRCAHPPYKLLRASAPLREQFLVFFAPWRLCASFFSIRKPTSSNSPAPLAAAVGVDGR